MTDYHDFVIRDGNFVGLFDEMYKSCSDPWPESEEDYVRLPTTSHFPRLLRDNHIRTAFSLGCGTGRHISWLSGQCPDTKFSGSDISATAIEIGRALFPGLAINQGSVSDFVQSDPMFDCLILREVLWYILDDWSALVEFLAHKAKGRFVAIEVSTYDDQRYGKKVFDGPDGLVSGFPFEILEVVRWHTSASQKDGHILIWGRI